MIVATLEEGHGICKRRPIVITFSSKGMEVDEMTCLKCGENHLFALCPLPKTCSSCGKVHGTYSQCQPCTRCGKVHGTYSQCQPCSRCGKVHGTYSQCQPCSRCGKVHGTYSQCQPCSRCGKVHGMYSQCQPCSRCGKVHGTYSRCLVSGLHGYTGPTFGNGRPIHEAYPAVPRYTGLL